MMHTILPYVQFINSREFSLNPLIIFFRLNKITISFTKTFIRKITSCDTFVISRMDFRHDPANEKCQAKWSAAKIFIIKTFDPTLLITKFCCRAVPDDRLGC